MGRSLSLEICQKMEIKIDETYHVYCVGKMKETIFPD